MNKFMKISISIIAVMVAFIGVNKLVFKDRITIEDYKITNPMYTHLRIDSYEKVDEGTIIKMKLKNASNYTYRLEDASITFWSCERDENGESTNLRKAVILNMIPKNHFDGEHDLTWDGLGPKEEGFIEFLLPKAMYMNEEFFDLDYTMYEYSGKSTKSLPIGEGSYTIVGSEEIDDFMQRLDSNIGEILKGE